MKSNRVRIVTAGVLFLVAHASLSWASAGFGPGQSLDVKEFLSEARASDVPAAPRIIMAGYISGNDPEVGEPAEPVEWIPLDGKKFLMGTDDGKRDATPVHEVAIKAFEMSKTVVTVEQYAECVAKGLCTKPGTGGYCNWGKAGRQRHPVNCVDWKQANQYAKFKGARLPSESEWEYAATSGGKNRKYPWGNEAPDCRRAVMYGDGGVGCGNDSTLPVCSKPAGNTEQGLCDMAGNVMQWVQDSYQDSYDQAPSDGSAVEAADADRVARGGSFSNMDGRYLRSDFRYHMFPFPAGSRDRIGFRLARSSR